MKRYSLIIGLFLSLFFCNSCDSSPTLMKATGLAYEAIVTMDVNKWNGELGEAVKNDMQSAVPGLLQYEPALKVTFVQPSAFDGILTYVRNILIVTVDPSRYTKTSVTYERDKWAKGQLILFMTTPDAETAIQYLNDNPKALVDFFVKEEMARATSQMEDSYSVLVYDKVKAKFNAELKVPSNMSFYRDTTGFFWASNNANTGRIDMAVYDFPYTDSNTFTVDYLAAKRDSVMQLNIPGAFPNSYMTTEKRVPIEYKSISLQGKYAGVMRGMWRMEGDMMGGPFVSVARLDETTNRVIVAEGFVYSPESDKRNYIRRIEAALYTLRLEGDEVASDK